MSFKEKSDFLWKTIGRFDIYYNSVNAKASALIAFNVFVVTGIAIKWNDLSIWFVQPCARTVAGGALFVAVAASIISLWKTFATVNPFLASPKKLSSYQSLIFFNHVAEYEKPEDYLDAIQKLNDDDAIKDLSFQAHALARGLKKKFADLRVAIGVILILQIPALALFFLLHLILRLIASFQIV
jgi:hypothetical protein